MNKNKSLSCARYRKALSDPYLGPFAQKSHQASTKAHDKESGENSLNVGTLHVCGEHELVSHELDETGVDQDACTDAVEDTIGDEGGLASGGEGLTNTETNGNGNGSANGVAGAEEIRRPALGFGPLDSCETGT